ncbi:MAG TPA: O-antigen ligase family protein [Syntrophobacteraceae bacterium]|nr:O-antigen ligase family protein [Syntrophobacteraceae bacterium]
MSISRILEWITLGTAFLMPLLFWPPSPQPFSTAKEWLLAIWVLAGFAIGGAGGLMRKKLPARALIAMAIWILALSLSAGTGDESSIRELVRYLLPCAGFLLLLWMEMRPQRFVLTLTCSGTLVALVALLQFAQLDPFMLLNLTGSLQGSSRIRIFSTLGNPNFVAAVLTAILPLTLCGMQSGEGAFPRTRRVVQICAVLIQAEAIVTTGSRAPILGFAAAGIWLLFRKAQFRVPYILLGLAVSAILISFSPGRTLEKTVAGRFYIWRIAEAHIAEVPLAGYGPGAFPLQFVQWETDYIQKNGKNADRSLSGFQDHAHNDYMEIFVDYGILGLLAFFIFIGLLTRPLLRHGSQPPLENGIAASIIALLAIAVVDFPLHRPTELYLFWTQLALLYILEERLLLLRS